MKKKVGILVGSLRKGSYSRSVANCVISLSSEIFDIEIIEIGDLPMYNQDYDADDLQPESYTKFRESIKSLDAVLIVTPEHNRSMSAVLKNALDVGSRPFGQNVWSGKPGGIISQSYGSMGGFGATQHLRQVLTFLDVEMMAQPECYLGEVMNSMDENGVITSDRTVKFLNSFIDKYKNWVDLILSKN